MWYLTNFFAALTALFISWLNIPCILAVICPDNLHQSRFTINMLNIARPLALTWPRHKCWGKCCTWPCWCNRSVYICCRPVLVYCWASVADQRWLIVCHQLSSAGTLQDHHWRSEILAGSVWKLPLIITSCLSLIKKSRDKYTARARMSTESSGYKHILTCEWY